MKTLTENQPTLLNCFNTDLISDGINNRLFRENNRLIFCNQT